MAARKTRRLDGLVSLKLDDFPTLTFGPSLITNVMPTAAGGICRIFRADGRKLAAVFRQQPSDRNFRLLDARGIVLALHHQPHLVLLEAVEDVAVGNRTQARVE